MYERINRKIPFFNFLFSLVIPVYHCSANVIETGPLDSRINATIIQSIENFSIAAMTFFFFVSAYLLFQTWSFRSYPAKLRRRLLSLFVPFVIWNAFAFLVDLLRGTVRVPLDLLKTLLLLEVPPNGSMWYLQAILLLAVLSPLFYLLLKNRRVGWFLVLAVMIGAAVCQNVKPPFYMTLWRMGHLGNTFFYFPSYLTGAYFGIHAKDITEKDALSCLLCILAVGFCLDCCYPGAFSRFFQSSLAPFILILFPSVEWLEDRKVYRTSFLIYSLHSPLFALGKDRVAAWIIRFVPHAAFQTLAIRFVCLFCVFLTAAFLCAVLGKLCPPVLSVLTGGRAVRRREKA